LTVHPPYAVVVRSSRLCEKAEDVAYYGESLQFITLGVSLINTQRPFPADVAGKLVFTGRVFPTICKPAFKLVNAVAWSMTSHEKQQILTEIF